MSAQRLSIPAGETSARLHAVLRGSPRAGCCAASVQKASGTSVWSIEHARLRTLESAQVLEVDVPAALLSAGDYSLVLRNAGALVDSYDFRVVESR